MTVNPSEDILLYTLKLLLDFSVSNGKEVVAVHTRLFERYELAMQPVTSKLSSLLNHLVT